MTEKESLNGSSIRISRYTIKKEVSKTRVNIFLLKHDHSSVECDKIKESYMFLLKKIIAGNVRN